MCIAPSQFCKSMVMIIKNISKKLLPPPHEKRSEGFAKTKISYAHYIVKYINSDGISEKGLCMFRSKIWKKDAFAEPYKPYGRI